MAIIRVEKTKDYTVMSNFHLRDKRLSFKAKGLLSQMLSMPDDWDFSVKGLMEMSETGKTTVQAALKELEVFGYLKRTREQDEKGRFLYVYVVSEKPWTGFPCTEDPWTDNQPQLNTKILNTKILSTNNRVFTPPTLEELTEYCEKKGYSFNSKRFISYYESNGWKVGRNKMRSWKATADRWAMGKETDRKGPDFTNKYHQEEQKYERRETEEEIRERLLNI